MNLEGTVVSEEHYTFTIVGLISTFVRLNGKSLEEEKLGERYNTNN